MRDDDLPGRLGELIRHGRIKTVDLSAGRITVALGDLETGPIRFYTGGAGGTRIWSRPKVGEQVTLLSPEGDLAGAIALRGVVSNSFPAICDEDREVIQFEDGATLAYDPAAHAMDLVLPAGATLSIAAPGGVRIDADVRISGDLLVDGDVVAGTVSLKDHRHTEVQAGAALSGKPKP